MKLTQFVPERAIIPQLAGAERDDVIEELLDALIASGAAPRESRAALLGAIRERERHSSTGFGCGVAVPHVKHRTIPRIAAAIGVAPRGVEFNALDGKPVYSVFLLLSPEDQPEEHLLAMEVIFKHLTKESFRRLLWQAQTAPEIVALLEDADGHHAH